MFQYIKEWFQYQYLKYKFKRMIKKAQLTPGNVTYTENDGKTGVKMFSLNDLGLSPGAALASNLPDRAAYERAVLESSAKHSELQTELIRTTLQFTNKMKSVKGNDMDVVATLWFSLITEINLTMMSAFRGQTDEDIKDRLMVMEASLLQLMNKSSSGVPYSGPIGQA